jgi:hypothetical protein
MSETKVTRRPRGEDALYFDAAKNRYVGSVSLGYGADGKLIRCKVFGKTKQECSARGRRRTYPDERAAVLRECLLRRAWPLRVISDGRPPCLRGQALG